jgi:hypothetical protein
VVSPETGLDARRDEGYVLVMFGAREIFEIVGDATPALASGECSWGNLRNVSMGCAKR